MAITREQVLQALATVKLGEGGASLASSGRLSEILIDPTGRVMFSIAVDPARRRRRPRCGRGRKRRSRRPPGVESVVATLTAERAPPRARAGAGTARPRRPPRPRAKPVAGVRHVIAVASGKGGVGKSTTACNLALALSALAWLARSACSTPTFMAHRMPRLLAIKGKPQLVPGTSRTLQPMQGYGLKVMSIGFLVEEETAMIWRGPMVMGAIQQMLREVAWGELDVLVVDMPPGHRRRTTHHGAGGAARRRRDRLDAAGPRPD